MGCGMIIDDTLYASILLLLQCYLIGYLVRFSFADIALPWAIDNVAYLRWLSIIIHAHNPPGNEKGTISFRCVAKVRLSGGVNGPAYFREDIK